MPEAAVQTELEADVNTMERKFKQEVLAYVEGDGALPSSEALLWLGHNNIAADQRSRNPKLIETAVMAQSASLSLRISPPCMCLTTRLSSHLSFIVVADDGLHKITVDFCGCTDKPRSQQLMEANLYPDSSLDPTSATTFHLALRNGLMRPIGIVTHASSERMEKLSAMKLPDEKLRLEHIDALKSVKLAVEERMIQAQAQLDSIRDRYELDDDDLAFEVEMRPSEEAVCWEAELEILKEERRQIIRCIEHSEKFCETYIVQFPEPEEEEEAPMREPISRTAAVDCPSTARPLPTSLTMPKKKCVLKQLRKPPSHAPHSMATETHSTANEIRERRRLAADATNAADAANAGEVKTWVSDSWDAAMDSLLELHTSGDVEVPDDTVDGVSMDLGFDDDQDSDYELLDATQIVCHRSFPRGDPLEAEWDALTYRLWPNYEMPAGVRHSIEMEHPHRPSRNAGIPKHQLFSTISDAVAGSIGGDVSESITGEMPEEGTDDLMHVL
ncbi:hypothetical protein C8R43DRAFT_1121725 [Mycena crocata]|nr:hypothetical protein C8R43DRAFT_1121725 [Mycena crocata]